MLESLLITSESLQLYLEKTPTQVFPVNIAKFPQTPILKNICKRLLLTGVNSFFYNQTSLKREFIRYSYLKKKNCELMMTVFLFHFLLSVHTNLQWRFIYCLFFLLYKTLLIFFFKCYDVDFIWKVSFYLCMKRDPLRKRGVGLPLRHPLPYASGTARQERQTLKI